MKYRITAKCTVEVVTMIEANSEDEALNEAYEREVDICTHGSELAEHEINEADFCLVDGCSEALEQFEAEEYEN